MDSEENKENTIIGGLDSGRIAIWDLKSNQRKPNQLSFVSPTSSYLPLAGIKKIDKIIYTIGHEGRLARWDTRKLEKPIIMTDIVF